MSSDLDYKTIEYYTGNGIDTDFLFSWEVLDPTDLKVLIYNTITEKYEETTAWTRPDSTSIVRFNLAPGYGVRIIIYRLTDIDSLSAIFHPGHPVKAGDLNDNFERLQFAVQEVRETYLNLYNGGVVEGNVTFNGNVTINKYPTNDTDATNKLYVDTTTVSVTGDTMTGQLAMSNQKITALGSPELTSDAANKQYVDGILYSGGGNVSSLPVVRHIITALGGETLITLPSPISRGKEIVTINGSTLTPSDDYTFSGDNIVLNSPLRAGNELMVLGFNSLEVVEVSANFETFPYTRWVTTATAGQTTFTGGVPTLAYSPGFEAVYLNGALQTRAVDYAAGDGSTVTLTQAALAGDVVEIHSSNYIQTGTPEGLTAQKYTYPNGVDQTIQQRLEQYVSVKDFGAVGDGVTDDTTAIQNAVNAAQNSVLKRLYGGFSVYFPSGVYLISSTITLEETNIPSGGGQNGVTLVGAGATSSSLIANNPDFDFVKFVGKASRSYYGGGVKNMGFHAIGNATAGALLNMYRTIGSSIDDVQFDGGYENLVLDGCADLLISNFYGVDVSRSSGSIQSFIQFSATEFVCSDVHLSNVQIKPTAYAPDYSIIINGSDGIYCTNGHQFGGLRFEPKGVGVTTSTTSTFWNNWYFDTASSNNIFFIGNCSHATKYNNHRFTSCDLRNSNRGFTIDGSSAVQNFILSDSRIAFHQKDGVYVGSSSAEGIVLSNCVLNDNNRLNSASYSDVHWSGLSGIITGCIFRSGDAAGTALKVLSGAVDTVVGDCNFSRSTSGTKIVDNGVRTTFSNLAGVTVSNSGTATIVAGGQNVTVPHGCDLVPSIDTINITAITNAPGVTRWYADTVSPTSFAIRTNTSPTTDVNLAWQISYK